MLNYSPMIEHTLLYNFRISEDAASALDKIPRCIEEANPISFQHRAELRYSIRSLWRLLTMGRAQRASDYLNNPTLFSAYLRYFMPWNLVRLVSLLTDLPVELKPNATITDMGSGPLTLLLSLYCSKPELRKLPLTIICVDRAPRMMETGKTILEILAAEHSGELPPWKIELRHLRFGEPIREKADLFCAINVFNEFFWKSKETLFENADALYRSIMQYCKNDGSLLILEPGEPRCGGFLSALRAVAIRDNCEILAPCPHTSACPMPGIFKSGQEYLIKENPKNIIKKGIPRFDSIESKANVARQKSEYIIKQLPDESSNHRNRFLTPVRMPAPRVKYPWCHFSMPTSYAPKWLYRLSQEAGLAKDKLSFSYLYVKRCPSSILPLDQNKKQKSRYPGNLPLPTGANEGYDELACRIVSEPIVLSHSRVGKYACSHLGYTLISTGQSEALPESGALLRIATKIPASTSSSKKRKKEMEYDQKTGAILISYESPKKFSGRK